MKHMDCYIGIDLGTSSVKAAIFDVEGACLGGGQAALSKLSGFSVDRHLHSPHQWWDKTVLAVRGALVGISQDYVLRGIACCGFHHVPVFLNVDGEPAMPVVMMHDVQLPVFRKRLQDDGRLEKFHRATHSLVSSAHLPSITEAVRELFPQQWSLVRHVIMSKDYLRYRLTGNIGTEYCDATGTNLIAFGEQDWSADLADSIGIKRSWLTPIAKSTDLAGELLPEAAGELGIPAGIPVFYGGGDSHCALLGLGCIENGSSAVLLGTNCTLRMVFNKPMYDPRVRLWCQRHVIPGFWTVSASSLAGSSVISWSQSVLRSDNRTNSEESAQQERACTKGLYFLPFIHGERCPFHNPQASGTFVGLRSYHTSEDMLQAVREGISFVLKMCWELVCSLAGLDGQSSIPPVLSGGGSQDYGWGQLIADVLGQELRLAVDSFAGCRGAAMLAAIGAGSFTNHEEAIQRVKAAVGNFTVVPTRNERLNQYYQRFCDLVEKFVI